MSLPPDLADRYQIIRPIADGGMGSVYQIRDRRLNRILVAKTILLPTNASLEDREEFQERFRREALLAAQLDHPNIARIYDISSDGTWIVMEFVEGLTLREMLKTGRQPLGWAVEIARQALQALSYLHHKGAIHRDISPDNLMITRSSEGTPNIKLIDLGIARALADQEAQLTGKGGFIGKPSYASPEHLFDLEPLDARSDVFSLGVVLYEILTGKLPFPRRHRSPTQGERPLNFVISDPEGNIPEELREIVLRAIEEDPERRYRSAEEFKSHLAAFQSRQAFVARSQETISSPIVSATPPRSEATHPEKVHVGSERPLPVVIAAQSQPEVPLKSLDPPAPTSSRTRQGSAPETPPRLALPAPEVAPKRDQKNNVRGLPLLLAACAALAILFWIVSGDWDFPSSFFASDSDEYGDSGETGRLKSSSEPRASEPRGSTPTDLTLKEDQEGSRSEPNNLPAQPREGIPQQIEDRGSEGTSTPVSPQEEVTDEQKHQAFDSTSTLNNPPSNGQTVIRRQPYGRPQAPRVPVDSGKEEENDNTEGPDRTRDPVAQPRVERHERTPHTKGRTRGEISVLGGDELFESEPAMVLVPPEASYPEAARGTGTKAQVVIGAWIDATGIVSDARVESIQVEGPASAGLFEAAALQAVRNARYAPARERGNPVRAWITQTFTFEVR